MGGDNTAAEIFGVFVEYIIQSVKMQLNQHQLQAFRRSFLWTLFNLDHASVLSSAVSRRPLQCLAHRSFVNGTPGSVQLRQMPRQPSGEEIPPLYSNLLAEKSRATRMHKSREWVRSHAVCDLLKAPVI